MATETAQAGTDVPAPVTGAPDDGGPRRAPAGDAHHAGHRGAGDDALPPGQGARLVLRRLRPGGGVRRARRGRCTATTASASCTATSPRTSSAASRPTRIFAQYMGREGGITRGRDGNVHFGDRTARLRRDGLDAAGHDARRHRAGDGVQAARRAARRAHVVRRRLDLARRLPRGDELGGRAAAARSIFVLENNQYAYSTPLDQQFAVDPVERAAAYGFPGVRSTATTSRRCSRPRAQARERALAGEGPTMIEAVTMRMHGHAAHDDMKYVPRGADRGVAAQGPDRPPGAPARGAGRRRRRAARGGRRGDRARGRGGARHADARRRDRGGRRVRRRARAARGRRRALERLRRGSA